MSSAWAGRYPARAPTASPKLLTSTKLLASTKLLGRSQRMAKQVGTAGSGPRARYAVGVSPTIRTNVRTNVPRLENPTAQQTSVTLVELDRLVKSRGFEESRL